MIRSIGRGATSTDRGATNIGVGVADGRGVRVSVGEGVAVRVDVGVVVAVLDAVAVRVDVAVGRRGRRGCHRSRSAWPSPWTYVLPWQSPLP